MMAKPQALAIIYTDTLQTSFYPLFPSIHFAMLSRGFDWQEALKTLPKGLLSEHGVFFSQPDRPMSKKELKLCETLLKILCDVSPHHFPIEAFSHGLFC